MKPTRAILALIFLAGLGGSIVATVFQQRAYATRNSTGTYSLPAGNPVTTGTTITSAWANSTFADVGTELTNSLDRQGRGAMTAPLQLAAGSAPAPALTFSVEPTSGLYRSASNDLRFSVASNDVQKWTAAGVAVTGTLTTSGALTATGAGTFSSTLGAVGLTTLDGGVQVGPGGSAITGSYAGTYSWVAGGITAGNCATSSRALFGAAVGGVCVASMDSANTFAVVADCQVTATSTVLLRLCAINNTSATTFNVRYRVFQP